MYNQKLRLLPTTCRKSVVTKVSCKAFGSVIGPGATEQLRRSLYDA